MSLTGSRLILLIGAFIGGCFYISAQRPAFETLPSLATASVLEGAGQEAPAKVQAVTVNPVRQAGGNVPLNANAGGGQSDTGLVKGLDRNNVVGVAMNEKDGRPRDEIASKPSRLDQHPRKAGNGSHRTRTAEADVKRHHRALAKADKRKRTVVKAQRRKLAVKKSIKKGRRLLHTAPALARVSKRKLKPLPSPVWVGSADFWRVW